MDQSIHALSDHALHLRIEPGRAQRRPDAQVIQPCRNLPAGTALGDKSVQHRTQAIHKSPGG